MMEYIYLGGLMDKTELNDEVQIDLSELFKLIRKHANWSHISWSLYSIYGR